MYENIGESGLAPELSKRELMHYSWRKKYDCNPPITLEDYDGTTRTIVPDKFVRWLDVVLRGIGR